MIFDNIKASALAQCTKAGYLLKAKSPEILIIGGVVGIVGGTVLACRATLKAGEVITEMQHSRVVVDQATAAVADPENAQYTTLTYSETDRRADIASIYIKGGVKLLKLYAPAIILSGLGIGAVLTSHGIMKKRNLALISAYDAVSAGFEAYRKRVQEELGESMDKKLRYGLRDESVTVEKEDKKGKLAKTETTVPAFDGSVIGPYAKFFSPETSSQFFKNNPSLNLQFLQATQNHLNDLLHSRGFLFLNEVLSSLGLKIVPEGQMLGWLDNQPDCQGFVDLGIFAARNMESVNGVDRDGINAYLLDIRPDGDILDRI